MAQLSSIGCMHRLRLLLVMVAGAFPMAAPALGAEPAPAGGGVVVIAEVRGPLEQHAIDFLAGAVATEEAGLVVLQIDNPGVASGDPQVLFDAVAAATVPVVAWVGPSGATAYGGVAQLLTMVDHAGAAPGASIGFAGQTMAGDPLPPGETAVQINDVPVAGVIDAVVPTIGQYIASLEGMTFATAAGPVTLDVAETVTAPDGTETVVASSDVRFIEPGLFTRFLRLAIRPEATFFFLVAGLAAAGFELYAAGVGITAAVASTCLLLAGFGAASLPLNWIAAAGALLGVVLVMMDFQNASPSWRGALGTLALLFGGLNLTTAAPQFAPRWWTVVLTVVCFLAFVVVALTTVARSRFSTRTIGRAYLIGRRGVASTGFDPTGIVELDGARWRARTHRSAGVGPGDPIEVLAVSGIMLEVGPPQS